MQSLHCAFWCAISEKFTGNEWQGSLHGRTARFVRHLRPQQARWTGCIGAPDLIVEILSKGNSKKEVETKYELYQENGVREYWIVFPYEEVIQQHVLDGEEHYRLRHMYSGDSIATSVIFPQLSFQAAQIFED